MAEKKSENAKAAAKKTAKKPNVFKRLAKYLGSCKSEIKKITWPTAKQTTKNFGIVIAMVAIVGVFIFALDQGLYAATDLMTTAENRNLQDMIIDVKVPVEIVTETVGDKTKEVENKLFPGYVFVKMVYTDETWYVVRNIRGCTGFVGPGSKPVPLTDAEVYRMGVETRSVKLNYSVGDSVRIIDGPLEDFVGVVEEIDADKDYVRVVVSMFGRETPVELELAQAEPIED